MPKCVTNILCCKWKIPKCITDCQSKCKDDKPSQKIIETSEEAVKKAEEGNTLFSPNINK